MEYVSLEDRWCDDDLYEDLGYAIFLEGDLQEIRDEYMDFILAHVTSKYSEDELVEVREAYLKTTDEEQEERFGAVLWTNI